MSQPFNVAEVFTGSPGKYASHKVTIRSIKVIIAGEYDNHLIMATTIHIQIDIVSAAGEVHTGDATMVFASASGGCQHDGARATSISRPAPRVSGAGSSCQECLSPEFP